MELPGVTGVFFANDFISVTKSDGEWQHLKPAVLGVVTEFFLSGAPLIEEGGGDAVTSGEFFDAKDAETVEAIKELIETRVRPAVAGDGGDIIFKGFRDGVVYLKMKGACSGCPSSTATLRHGIQNLLKHFLPDIQGWSRSRAEAPAASKVGGCSTVGCSLCSLARGFTRHLWIAMARGGKRPPNARPPSRGSRISCRSLVAAYLLAAPRSSLRPAQRPLRAPGHVACAAWRGADPRRHRLRHLGAGVGSRATGARTSRSSATMSLSSTGPYRWVRHPIYTGVLLAILGTALAVGEWRGLLAVALAGARLLAQARDRGGRDAPAVRRGLRPLRRERAGADPVRALRARLTAPVFSPPAAVMTATMMSPVSSSRTPGADAERVEHGEQQHQEQRRAPDARNIGLAAGRPTCRR